MTLNLKQDVYITSDKDIEQSYDVGNDFFDCILGEVKNYSCANWDEADSLEEAQIKKMHRIAKFANVNPGDSVLDIGCGWGTMMKFLTSEYKVKDVTGLTLSKAQMQEILKSMPKNMEVIFKSWQEFQTNRKYDAIVSIGAMEHFCSYKDRSTGLYLKTQKKFFEKCHYLLGKGGRMGLQTITSEVQPRDLEDIKNAKWLYKEHWPGVGCPYNEEIFTASRGMFEIMEWKTNRLSYKRTCEEWKVNLQKNEAYLLKNYGSTKYESFIKFVTLMTDLFDRNILGLSQISFKRID